MKRHLRSAPAYAAAFAIVALVAGPAHAQAQAGQGAWSMAGQTTTLRNEIGAVELNGKIYVMGGQTTDRQDSPLAQEFDPATGRWRDLAPLPKGVSHVGVATLNGKIYVAGGFTRNVHMDPLDQFVEYDPATNQWRTLTPLSSRRGSVGLAAIGGKLHVIGGRTPDTKTVTNHEVYDPATGKWTTAAPLPVARDHLGIITVDGKIYVIGGRTGATVDNTAFTDIYDPSTDKWQAGTAMPTKRSSGAIAYYHGLIVYHGGECKDATKRITFDEYEAYDPKANSWVMLAKAPTGLHAHAAAAVGNTVYFMGGTAGCGGDGPSSAVYTFRLP
jgi:N-acetylneuraminic acid mutarotase